MKGQPLNKIILANTLSSYVLAFGNLVSAIIITRLLYHGLGDLSYGFWVLLWAIFGYSVLLDFGFGTSVQKYTAEVTVTRDFDKYNRLISTVFTIYALLALIIIGSTVLGSSLLPRIFHFPEGTDTSLYKTVFLIFGIGAAFVFPTGAFLEILVGLKKIYLRNIIQLTTTILNLVGIIIIFEMSKGLKEIAIFSILLHMTSNLAMGYICRLLLPEMRISPRRFDIKLMREVLSFSIYAYIITFSYIIIMKTDQIVLGLMLGVEAVAIYQIGSRHLSLRRERRSNFNGC